MARQKTPEELSEALGFFPPGSVKSVNRLLKRAAEKQAREARRGVRPSSGTRAGTKLGKSLGNALAKQLSKAMRQRGATRREQPSVKQKAPDTNGRPFHFAHSTVNKDDAAPATDGGAEGKSANKAAAHMKYIEREIAVERAYGAGMDGREGPEIGGARLRGPEEMVRDVRTDQNEKEGAEMSSAGAGQRYIENPVKLANGENIVFSFGTIGDRFEDRVRFWEQLEEHEVHPGARVQNRLIMELPHEATPEARFEIVKGFCKEFDKRGLPYWAALHAPGKDNDSRNFHAHVVFSDRPSQRMVDGEDGKEKWDFEITRTKVKASRNVVTQHPFRQNRHPDFRRKDILTILRKSFADSTNSVLMTAPAKDKDGEPVIYDARSYKDMGLDTIPMKSVDRIVADKMRSGKLTVLDKDFSKKMIRAELQEALARRDKGIMELVRLDQALDALAREPNKAKATNKRLPKEMRVSPLAQLTSKAVRAASVAVLDAKRAALSDDLMERSTRTSLDRIIKATDEKVVKASAKNTRDPVRRGELPSEEAARLLNAAAREELALLNQESEVRRKRTRYRIGIALSGWKDVVGPRLPETSPIMAQAIRDAQTKTPIRETGTKQAREAPGARSPIQEEKTRKVAMMTPGEFGARIRRASEMTSAIIAQIAKMPNLEDRLRVIDAFSPESMRKRAERLESEAASTATPRDTQTQSAGQPATQPPSPNTRKAEAGGQRTDGDGAPTGTRHPTGMDLESVLADAERKKRERERKKRERKAVLARRNRNGRSETWSRG